MEFSSRYILWKYNAAILHQEVKQSTLNKSRFNNENIENKFDKKIT